jgi:DUF1680 family protein
MLAWRLLLATGEPDYADAIERTMYNGVLAGLSASGTEFFYVNPLQRRTVRADAPAGHGERASWYPCACCPPNLMRMLSSWQQYVATSDDSGVQVHQYATGEIRADLVGGPVRLSLRTDYPWRGRIAVRVLDTPVQPWSLSLRVPRWCRAATLTGPDEAVPVAAAAGCVELLRQWRAGDVVVLDLDMPVRLTEPDPRIDAVRGCVAVERGPLVYCVESADAPPNTTVEDLELDLGRSPVPVARPDIGAHVVGITVPVSGSHSGTAGAIPYFAWANRKVEGMRVWIPTR